MHRFNSIQQKQSFQHKGLYDTGISNYHYLIYTFLKFTYVKIRPNEVVYKNIKIILKKHFLTDLTPSLDQLYTRSDYKLFESTLTPILYKHAPQIKKLVKGNEKPQINRA